ncbi:MAG: ferric reductase-like transmembrane domain-containing protein [Pseudomonadota bacterium]
MNRFKLLLNSPYLFWGLLALPSIGMISGFLGGDSSAHRLLHPTGEFAARFMILAMMITPLRMLFANARWPLWLVRRRRYLGVAAFGYATLHVLFYIIDEESFSNIIAEALQLSIWTGWVAFLIFIPLFMTSNDWAVRKLKRTWKPLQRWVYAAALLTLAHWIFLEYDFGPALVHFLPLAALETFRVLRGSVPSRVASRA